MSLASTFSPGHKATHLWGPGQDQMRGSSPPPQSERPTSSTDMSVHIPAISSAVAPAPTSPPTDSSSPGCVLVQEEQGTRNRGGAEDWSEGPRPRMAGSGVPLPLTSMPKSPLSVPPSPHPAVQALLVKAAKVKGGGDVLRLRDAWLLVSPGSLLPHPGPPNPPVGCLLSVPTAPASPAPPAYSWHQTSDGRAHVPVTGNQAQEGQ